MLYPDVLTLSTCILDLSYIPSSRIAHTVCPAHFCLYNFVFTIVDCLCKFQRQNAGIIRKLGESKIMSVTASFCNLYLCIRTALLASICKQMCLYFYCCVHICAHAHVVPGTKSARIYAYASKHDHMRRHTISERINICVAIVYVLCLYLFSGMLLRC